MTLTKVRIMKGTLVGTMAWYLLPLVKRNSRSPAMSEISTKKLTWRALCEVSNSCRLTATCAMTAITRAIVRVCDADSDERLSTQQSAKDSKEEKGEAEGNFRVGTSNNQHFDHHLGNEHNNSVPRDDNSGVYCSQRHLFDASC